MIGSDEVKALVARQAAVVADATRREALRGILLPVPRREERDWEYGEAGERFPYWVVAESPARGIILVYCEQGFGPESPWGFLFVDAPTEAERTLGMDSQWHRNLEGAFVHSGLARPGPR